MASNPIVSLFVRVVVPAIGALAAAASPAPANKGVAAAQDGKSLQAILDRAPQSKEAVSARAAALGIGVIVLQVGERENSRAEMRVTGGAKSFLDCEAAAGCPPMVVVPASPPGFMIGSPETEAERGEDEQPTAVTIRAFAIGTRPVTVAEYTACVAAGGCKPPEWLEPGGEHNIETGPSRYYANLGEAVTGPDRPIVGVSYIDATAYATWLSHKTGHAYRLPSEAEWEMAARAGSKTAFWWGDALPDDGIVRAACAGCGSQWDSRSPAPADAFTANPWGLHNVHGNVWQWVADFYCEDYGSGPKDGSPRLIDDCSPVGDRPPARGVRSLRGGSSFYPPKAMRSAMRVRNVPDFRNFSVGFRVARDLEP